MRLSFTGKSVLILGGNSDIGLTTARFAMEAGLLPVLTCRSENSEAAIHDAIKGDCAVMRFDPAHEKGAETLLNAVSEKTGTGPDYVVDAAQGHFERLVASADDGDVETYILENVARKAALIKALARNMLRRKFGRFVFVSSAAALRLNPGQGFYAASKQAVETLYRCIGVELGQKGISSVSLRPGYVDAGRGRAYLDQENKEIVKNIPAGRLITVEDIAGTVLFLLSDAALMINATEIVMDGGMTAAKGN